MTKEDGIPRTLSRRETVRNFLERNKIFIDLLSAITAAVALLALYSTNQSLRLARQEHELQAADLQPVFQVFFKREFQARKVLPPRYSDIRVVSPSGTFLDATAKLNSFLVVGYREGGEPTFWSPPDRDLAIIPAFQFDYNLTVVSDKRGTLIQAWDDDSEVAERAEIGWWLQNKKEGLDFDKLVPVVEFVAIVEVSYLDILRRPHSIYFKVGGIQLSTESIPSLRAAGRAPTLDPAVGKRCFEFYNRNGAVNFDTRNLRPLYDRFMKGSNKDLGKACG
jgi:hypothetical protein